MYDIVITNGFVVTPAGVVAADLAINGEQIAAVGMNLNADRVIDAAGAYVIPGGVDPHVHLQMQLGGRTSTDSFATGTVAAACGGTTALVDFADPQPGQSMLDALRVRRAEADPAVAIDYALHMTVPTWHGAAEERLAEIDDVLAAGCLTFKLYQAYQRMELDDVSLYRVMKRVGAAGGRVVLHSETGPLLDELRRQALAQGHTAAIWHERTRPARLEATAVHRAAEIAYQAECPLYVFHVGCADSVAAIVAARLRGVDIVGESCPQYLVLTADHQLDSPDGNLFICAPPLRSHEDQDALWLALADDDLQVVSTDHCPWTRAEKMGAANFADVPGGVPSIEARLALVHHFGVNQEQLDLSRWVDVCCTKPAQLMGLDRKGALLPGFDADIVIFDPDRAKTLNVDTLHEAADWTPYAGVTVQGWPRTVLARGRVIVEDEVFVGELGQGHFVERFG
ncbi:MAG: dihydropyrimidinase [Caldilineaceae bacterium]